MERDFLNIDEKISMSEKYLDFHYSNYQRIQVKLSVLTIIYTLISIFLIQVIKFPFSNWEELMSFPILIYINLLVVFLVALAFSIYYAYKVLKPINNAYLNPPRVFYNELEKQYRNKLPSEKHLYINQHIKASYLKELELAIDINLKAYQEKSNNYDNAFAKGLLALVFYIFCVSFTMIYESETIQKVEIVKIITN